MPIDKPEIIIEQLLPSSAAQRLTETMDTIVSVQKGLYSLATSEDSDQFTLLKIGSVFQIFLIDTLASGKRPKDLTKEDWRSISDKVLQYAVLEEGQSYSEFVFTLYADYIDISADSWIEKINENNYEAIKGLSAAIRNNNKLLQKGEIKESDYVEECLWLSLEAMIKLLFSLLHLLIGPEYAALASAISQMAFEYGRYVLYAREQALLQKYIENQHILDEELRREYEDFLKAVNEEAERFRHLIDEAFSSDIRKSLLKSAELARAAGVKEEELLTSVEDIDDFFLN